MPSKLNIHIALFICAVFIARALFLNLGSLDTILHADSTEQSTGLTNPHKLSAGEAAFHEHLANSTQTDLFEEVNDKQEDYLSHIGSLAVLSLFYSFLFGFRFFLRSERLFDLIKCVLYPKRYLSLSILRI